MPSRAAAAAIWDDQARQAYRNAVQSVVPAEEKCFNVSATEVSFSKPCMKKAFAPLKGKTGPLAQAWT